MLRLVITLDAEEFIHAADSSLHESVQCVRRVQEKLNALPVSQNLRTYASITQWTTQPLSLSGVNRAIGTNHDIKQALQELEEVSSISRLRLNVFPCLARVLDSKLTVRPSGSSFRSQSSLRKGSCGNLA